MKNKFILILILSSFAFSQQQVSSPYTISNVEPSGLFQGRNKVGDNVLKCYRFSRPCKLDSSKSMISDTNRCGNDEPFALMEIHDEDNTTCLSRQSIMQDNTNLYLLLQMPNDWHDYAKYAKNYFQSDSLKSSEGWKIKIEGLSTLDSINLRKYGPVSGSFQGALYLEGKKCKKCTSH